MSNTSLHNYNDRSIEILKHLAQFRSISPYDDGCIDYIAQLLNACSFQVIVKEFEGVKNLYAEKIIGFSQYASRDLNLCFAGHIDVVPPGEGWASDPFELYRKKNVLYCRGACDMKGAVAVALAVMEDLNNIISCSSEENLSLNAYHNTAGLFPVKVSCLLTADEEGDAINGTEKMLKWLEEQQYHITHCVLGEPTSIANVGDNIKTGRRGSINFTLEINGKQGHVAYPKDAINPNKFLCLFFANLMRKCEPHYYKETLTTEITAINCINEATNVVPGQSCARFNIRYDSSWASKNIIELIQDTLLETKNLMSENDIKYTGLSENNLVLPRARSISELKYELKYKISAESFSQNFANEPGLHNNFYNIVTSSIEKTLGALPQNINNGGTSDARFLCQKCQVIECGMQYETAHQINERIDCKDMRKLYNIYSAIVAEFMAWAKCGYGETGRRARFRS